VPTHVRTRSRATRHIPAIIGRTLMVVILGRTVRILLRLARGRDWRVFVEVLRKGVSLQPEESPSDQYCRGEFRSHGSLQFHSEKNPPAWRQPLRSDLLVKRTNVGRFRTHVRPSACLTCGPSDCRKSKIHVDGEKALATDMRALTDAAFRGSY